MNREYLEQAPRLKSRVPLRKLRAYNAWTRYNGASIYLQRSETTLAEDKLYKSEYVGSGTFIISKPKRKKAKQRQSNLKNLKRGSRK